MAGEAQVLDELDAEGLRAYLLGSLHYRAAAHEELTTPAQRALGWYRSLALRRGTRGLLLAWVYDLGHLLLEGEAFRFRSLVELGAWPAGERALRLDYENRLLNGFLRDPSCRRASELLRQDPAREGLITRLIELLLEPLLVAGGHADAAGLNPAFLRELAVQGEVDTAAAAARYDALAGEGALLEALRSSLERFFAARPPGPALGPDDLAEVEHWSAFKSRSQRLAARRIAAWAGRFPRVDPRGLAIAEEEDVDTELPDSGYYPTGGFSELATRGALENLVPTELVYMGEDPYGDAPDPPVDLFALRYLQRETLFFQRDSGQLRRTRRTVHLAVEPGTLRSKLPWHADQPVVFVYGLLVRLVEDLAHIFPADALRVELHLLAEGAHERERAEDDRELLQVLLRHEIARGAAAVHLVDPQLDLRARGERERRVYGVAVQGDRERAPAGLPAGPAPRIPPGLRAPNVIVWQIGGPAPGEEELGRVHMPVAGDPDAALVQARDAMLAEIAGVSRRGPQRRNEGPRLPLGLEPGARAGEFLNRKDGTVLVWLPPGRHRLGSKGAHPEQNQEQPPRDHDLREGLYVGRLPVTWGQYRHFCAETGRTPPRPKHPVDDAHPVHSVSYADAEAYAAWAGLRLPDEEEWECAARGRDARPYPWGFAPPEPGVHLTCGRDADGSEGWTTPVGSCPRGASEAGCLDLAGNVWEWVRCEQPGEGQVVRGGCWNAAPAECTTFARTRFVGKNSFTGFRLCR